MLDHRVAPWSHCFQKKGGLTEAAPPDQELHDDTELPTWEQEVGKDRADYSQRKRGGVHVYVGVTKA